MNRIFMVVFFLCLVVGSVSASVELDDVARISDEIRVQGAGWSAGVTSVSGLSVAEKRVLSLPVGPVRTDVDVTHFAASSIAGQGDSAFDWRDEGKVTPVRSQGSCGSCWAFSVVAAVESAVAVYSDVLVDLSEQHLVSDCCRAGSCSGGWTNWGLDYCRDTGIPEEVLDPYLARDSGCVVGDPDLFFRIDGYVYVEPSTDDFKCALKEYGPLAVVLTVPDDWYYYRSGIYTPVTDVGWANHAVLLVGWDDADGCWFIKNSWGRNWGEDGFARVKYGDLEKYDYAYAITGVVDSGASPVGWVSPVAAAATSVWSENYAAERAIDNNTNTHWFSVCSVDKEWITFDLGESLSTSRARICTCGRDLPVELLIETSDNTVHWTEVATPTLSNELEIVELNVTEARYVRVFYREVRRCYGTCSEFEVWVDPVPDPEPEPDPEPDLGDDCRLVLVYPDGSLCLPVNCSVVQLLLWVDGSLAFDWRNI